MPGGERTKCLAFYGNGRKEPAPWELYDLANDLSESKNLAGKFPERLEELQAVWEKLNREMIDPVFR